MWRRSLRHVSAVALLFSAFAVGHSDALPDGDRFLKVYQVHTGMQETVVFKRNGVYDKAGVARLNYIVRDWRKNQVKNMDPHLYDLLWQVYQASGSHDFIHIVCGYRSPETNAMLRRRSKGVAQHSQHMLGKAMDFYIPDVKLTKLREIGLRLQIGGVGFYPTSASPFVHMDTGGVRMWPRMTRDQLVRIFPNGRTLYVPSDGRPLPGYAEALAAYKSRKAAPILLASSNEEIDDGETADQASIAGLKDPHIDVPKPRLATRAVAAPAVVAMVEAGTPLLTKTKVPAATHAISFFDRAFGLDFDAPAAAPATPAAPAKVAVARKIDFEAASEVSTPVPNALAVAMAARDRTGRAAPAASLPIAPTAVVETVDISRPLRAEAMTTAVLRTSSDAILTASPVLAYASADLPSATPRSRSAAITGAATVPMPRANPMRTQPSAVASASSADSLYGRIPSVSLTLTALDTQTLRLWMGGQSTREHRYALLTMPEFGRIPSLLDKPTVTYAASFANGTAWNLRTDHFSGAIIQVPVVVDLTKAPALASR